MIPSNTSNLQFSKFIMEFPKMPFLNYFIQDFLLPGVSTSAVSVPSQFANMYRHGDKLEYDNLIISATVDEDLRVWEETLNWITALTKPDNFAQYEKYENYADAILTLNTNANNPHIRFKFTNLHPIALSPLQFSTKTGPDLIPTMDVTFRYDQYYIDRLQ